MEKFAAVGVFGRANAGKSTLVNTLVGEQVSIVSKRPQTTRKRILGILTKDKTQLVFCDTPGMHMIKNKLDAYMQNEILATLKGLQLGMYLVDLSDVKADEDEIYLNQLKSDQDCPMFLVLNKTDKVTEKETEQTLKQYEKMFDFALKFCLSAKNNENTQTLLQNLMQYSPEGQHAYDEEMYTSLSEREIVEEVIREVALKKFRQEIPHSLTVQVEQFKERENGKTYVEAFIYAEKESHKKIIVGKNGADIKILGQQSREKLNSLLNRDIFLQLWIKIRKDWRNSESWINRLGYKKTS